VFGLPCIVPPEGGLLALRFVSRGWERWRGDDFEPSLLGKLFPRLRHFNQLRAPFERLSDASQVTTSGG